MKRNPHGIVLGACVLCGVLVAGDAVALTDEEIFREFQFNFLNPGARAMALGGAFIAAADDATAIEANPAALNYLRRFEYFAEYRSIDANTQLFRPTRSFGSIEDVANLDLPYLNLQSVTRPENSDLLSFASFAVPFKIGNRRATIAFSHQVVLDQRNVLPGQPTNALTRLEVSTSDFPLFVQPGNPPSIAQYAVTNNVVGVLDAKLVQDNVGFSVALTPDFSLGVDVGYAQLDVAAAVQNTAADPRGILNTVNPRLDPDGDGLLSDVSLLSSIDDSDKGLAWSVGLHWHPDTSFSTGLSPFRFGMVYRKGAKLGVEESVFETSSPGSPGMPIRTFENTFRVPDRYGVGFSYETESGPAPRFSQWQIALDVERIKFSDLLENFRSGENFFTSGVIPGLGQDSSQPIVFDVDDGIAVRVGAQYSFVSRGQWSHAVRAGYYLLPDSRIRMTRFNSTDSAINELFLDTFRGGSDEHHFTVGFSLVTPVDLTIDFAGDFASERRQLVGSLIYRFGKIRI